MVRDVFEEIYGIMPMIESIQKALEEQSVDGWLLYDFRHSNPYLYRLLNLDPGNHATRRFFYWIPYEGNPVRLVHKIESNLYKELPGEERIYLSWRELHQEMNRLLKDKRTIFMEYSPYCALPTLSTVDGGTLEWVRQFGVEVKSSASLLQLFTATLSEKQIAAHREAVAICLNGLESLVPQLIGMSDYEAQQFLLEWFRAHGAETDWLPICAVGQDSANPHFSPSSSQPKKMKTGDFVLIDWGCKKKGLDGIYADLTRVVILGNQPSEKQREVFSIVAEARDKALALIRERKALKRAVYGWEVDDAARKVVKQAGYGKEFIHRLGHSLDSENHGRGANLDNLETREERELLNGTLFTIEPGIYLTGDFGIRLESDIFIHPNGEVEVTDSLQNEIRLSG